jgi:hypothetical protein
MRYAITIAALALGVSGCGGPEIRVDFGDNPCNPDDVQVTGAISAEAAAGGGGVTLHATFRLTCKGKPMRGVKVTLFADKGKRIPSRPNEFTTDAGGGVSSAIDAPGQTVDDVDGANVEVNADSDHGQKKVGSIPIHKQ